MEPKLHKVSAVLNFVFNASLSKIIVEGLTFHESKSEFTQPRYSLKSGWSSYCCSWIYHREAKNPLCQKLNSDCIKIGFAGKLDLGKGKLSYLKVSKLEWL